jgi:hypothetical protein
VRVTVALAIVLVVGRSKPAPPTLAPERAILTRIDTGGIGLLIELNAANSNSIDNSVRDVDAHIVLNGKYEMGASSLPGALTLPAGKSTRLDVPISLNGPI